LLPNFSNNSELMEVERRRNGKIERRQGKDVHERK